MDIVRHVVHFRIDRVEISLGILRFAFHYCHVYYIQVASKKCCAKKSCFCAEIADRNRPDGFGRRTDMKKPEKS